MRFLRLGLVTIISMLFPLHYSISQWHPTSGPGGGSILSIDAQGARVFLGGGNGAYRSTDNGNSWTLCINGLTSTNLYSIVSAQSKVFAGTSGGLFMSTNGGDSWTRSDSSTISKNVFGLAAYGTALFAGISSDGVYKSTNGGTSWFQSSAGLPTGTLVWSLSFIDSTLFAAAENGVFFSTNFGDSWFSLNNGLTNTPVYKVARVGSTLLAGTSKSVLAYVQLAGEWQPSSTGLPMGDLRAIMVDGNRVYAGTYDNAVFVSTNGGSTWSPFNSGFRNKLLWCLAKSDSILLAGTNGGGYTSCSRERRCGMNPMRDSVQSYGLWPAPTLCSLRERVAPVAMALQTPGELGLRSVLHWTART
jgi:photosystem II stability/assembly factor-like uncharacterized protein